MYLAQSLFALFHTLVVPSLTTGTSEFMKTI